MSVCDRLDLYWINYCSSACLYTSAALINAYLLDFVKLYFLTWWTVTRILRGALGFAGHPQGGAPTPLLGKQRLFLKRHLFLSINTI